MVLGLFRVHASVLATTRLLREDVPVARDAAGRPVGNASGTPITAKVRDHTASAVLARLKRDDPELADRVVTGEVSANAAAMSNLLQLQRLWRGRSPLSSWTQQRGGSLERGARGVHVGAHRQHTAVRVPEPRGDHRHRRSA